MSEVAERDVLHAYGVVMHDHTKCQGVATVVPHGVETFAVESPTCMSCGRPLRGLMIDFVDGAKRAYS